MGPIAVRRHFPTFAAGYCGLLRSIRVMCRVGVWLTPRVAMALVLVMSCELVWILAIPESTAGLKVPALVRGQTLLGFMHRTPPPWPRGNCFSVSSVARWLGPARGTRRIGGRVGNMHAENFSEIVKQLRLQTIEVEALDDGRCLVTDPRIPRNWLLEKPCPICLREPEAEDLLMRYPERFGTQASR
jgi:hypothetical protein